MIISRIAVRSVHVAHECAEGAANALGWALLLHDVRALKRAYTFADELANAIGWGLALGCVAAAAVE